MLHNGKYPGEYTLVKEAEDQADIAAEETRVSGLRKNSRPHPPWFSAIVLLILCFMLGAVGTTIIYRNGFDLPIFPASPSCKNPTTRQEWRNLSHDEKKEYIAAVQCLKERPSRLGLNQSLYDDFPYIHSTVGDDTHGAPSFLAWHRNFIHIYEQALIEECSYTNNLPYWDWSLDWVDLSAAPVWSSDVGFGTDGNATDLESIHGHCVTDGPFANLEVLYVEKHPYPHCLSREFAHGEALRNFSQAIRPAALKELLTIEDYETFNLAVEDGPHLSIPRFVHGDFSTITAPADPVFFLHHAQLDRLWWKWQELDLSRVGRQTSKALGKGKDKNAKHWTGEVLGYGDLGPDLLVKDIVSTEAEVLCYRY